jgi:hypothetical protein
MDAVRPSGGCVLMSCRTAPRLNQPRPAAEVV